MQQLYHVSVLVRLLYLGLENVSDTIGNLVFEKNPVGDKPQATLILRSRSILQRGEFNIKH